jgi:RimJ/RimL family protein N-acetyltransferase
MLKGEKIGLSAIEENELKALMDWRNIPAFRKHFREYRELNMTMQKKWFNKINQDNSIHMFSIKSLEEEKLLGCCGLTYIDWKNRNADLSLYIGYNNFYIDEEGYAKEASLLLFEYGFKELNLHKIWTEIYEYDDKKLKLYKEIGFKEDGRLRDNNYYNGQWWDSIMLSILKQEYNN